MKNTLFALSLSLLAACGGSSSSSTSNAPASVSGVTPNSAFIGRTLDVQLSGSGTNWTTATTVSFGDDITVNSVTAASPSALIANITIANTAKTGPRDITVTDGKSSEPLTMAFSIGASISVTTQGTIAQGGIVFLTIKNNDIAHPFDTTAESDGLTETFTNISFKTADSISGEVSNVTDTEIDATLLIDVDATVGNFDLDVLSGPAMGTQDEFIYPSAFMIAAQTATALADNTMVSLTDPYASKLYKYTPQAVGNLLALSASSDNATPEVLILDKSGSYANLLAIGASWSELPTSTDMIYVVVWDSGGTGADNATISVQDLALTTQPGGEGDDTMNDTYTGAVVLSTPPVIVQNASLSSATDVDWYAVTVPAGKAIHALTLDGDQGVDTALSFFASDGVTELGDPDASGGVVDNDTNDYGEDTVTNAVTAAGTYYIEVIPGYYYDPSATKYNLVVTLQ